MTRRETAGLAAALVVIALLVPARAFAHLTLSAGAKGGVNIANVDLNLAGLTISPKVDFPKFLVDLRYALGLTNVNRNTGPGEPEVKNRTFSIMFGVRLR